MISKFGTVAAPVEVVRRLFADIESWPQWMPAVREVRVLEHSETRALAEVDRVMKRRVQTTRLDFLFDPNGHRECQVAGIAKRWEADWRFQLGPHGAGTLVSCRLDIDMGFIGLFAPGKKIQQWIDRTFEETVEGARRQVVLEAAKRAAEESARPESVDSTIQVFAAPAELEIWIGGRKYVARASD